MEEERKSGLWDAADLALTAANAVRGAAKGMAAAVPAGAAVGALWGGRDTAAKALAAAGVLVLLPVLFLLLLPGLIFGGFGDAYSSHDPNAPILNSETAIVETANDLTFTVNAALAEGLEDVRARIQNDFSFSGADGIEIIDPYEDGPQGNISLFIAQYCAAKDSDFAGISISDLGSTLQREKDKLYSYQCREEWRERTEIDPDTGEERYADQLYGTDPIGGYGCGPTCMAMVVSSLTGQTVDPVEMARWAYDSGYWVKGGGSLHALIPAAAEHWGLTVTGCSTSEPQRILDALAEGKLVVAIMGAGHFTDSGHFILLRGVQNGQIMVADPYSVNYSNRLWDLSLILSEASRRAAAGGPFWIIG